MGIYQLSNNTVTLVPVDETYATEIFNANTGNVREGFAKFENLKDAKNWLHATLTLVNYGQKLEFCILNLNQEFLGMISLDNLETDMLEFRIWIDENHQKKGIATQASYLLLSYFNSEYPDKQLRYVSENKNEASMALAKKLGFHKVRSYKDDNNKSTTVFVFKVTNI
jgi:RimJ/RimL family protein N-acetyltransferase